jgi:hypothetical protein
MIISNELSSLGSADEIKSSVSKQLSRYNYTFPTSHGGPGVSDIPYSAQLQLTHSLAQSTARLVMRTKPYRNSRIISVICDLYFQGGVGSFAERFNSRFPIHQGLDGNSTREVPVSMVALVATAVRMSL